MISPGAGSRFLEGTLPPPIWGKVSYRLRLAPYPWFGRNGLNVIARRWPGWVVLLFLLYRGCQVRCEQEPGLRLQEADSSAALRNDKDKSGTFPQDNL